MSVPDYDVVIVGAGLAGLAAARTCVAADLDVCVLEANGHVGGRTFSQVKDGLTLDLGAEWVESAHHAAAVRELARYGLELDAPESPASPYWAIGDLVERRPSGLIGEAEEGFRALCVSIDADVARIDADDPRWHEAAAEFDIPMTDYLDRFTPDATVRAHFLRHCFALFGADEASYSAMYALHEFAAFGSCEEAFTSETARVKGGTMRIAESIAEELGERIRLGTTVNRISTGDGPSPVRVFTSDGAMTARAVIVAVPVNALRGIDLEVPLSTAEREVIATGHSGAVVKVWLRTADLPDPYWSFGWPDVPESYGRSGPGGQQIGAFQLVTGGDTSGAADRALEVMQLRHPEVTFDDETLHHDWINDPLTRGTWCTPTPGQATGLYELAAESGPCFFAGGDLSRRWAGWMDGALTSGEDAAERCAAYIGHQAVPEVVG